MATKKPTPRRDAYYMVTVSATFRLYGFPEHMPSKGIQALQKAVRSNTLEATVSAAKVTR